MPLAEKLGPGGLFLVLVAFTLCTLDGGGVAPLVSSALHFAFSVI
jgi:hypothetical protein